jgi:hypothetical protein
MRLSRDDIQLFYKLHSLLLVHASRKLGVLPDEEATPEGFRALPPETGLKVRDVLHAQPERIDDFVQENPADLAPGELEIVRGWKHAIVGSFYVFRFLKRYTVFLVDGDPPKAYGVLALTNSFEELVGPVLPVFTRAILLPWKDSITYDGLLNPYRISFGPGIRRRLNESYREAKATFGIITSLPFGE